MSPGSHQIDKAVIKRIGDFAHVGWVAWRPDAIEKRSPKVKPNTYLVKFYNPYF
jgi:hypothetical protein